MENNPVAIVRPSDSRIAPLFRQIAETFAAMKRCESTLDTSAEPHSRENAEHWREIHESRINQAVRDFLPSGSGFDSGTVFDFEDSKPDRLRFETSFHHMNENGFYDGWSEHVVTLRPSFSGFDLTISGRDRNGIKDYIAETFDSALRTPVFIFRDGPGDYGRVDTLPELSAGELSESAACLWESVLDPDSMTFAARVNATRNRHGASALRLAISDLAAVAHVGWTLAQRDGFDSPFDWEFCPAFVARALEWSEDGSALPMLRTDWRDIARQIGREDAGTAATVRS